MIGLELSIISTGFELSTTLIGLELSTSSVELESRIKNMMMEIVFTVTRKEVEDLIVTVNLKNTVLGSR